MISALLSQTTAPATAGGSDNASTLADQAAAAVTGTLDQVVLGNTITAWIRFAAILITSYLLAWVVRTVIAARLKKWASRTTTQLDDLLVTIVDDIRIWLIAPALVYFASRGMVLTDQAERAIYLVAMFGVAVQLIMSSRLLIDFGLGALLARNKLPDGAPDPTLTSSLGVLRVIAMLVIGSIVVLLALDNLGVEIKPLLAGLGIGGIAVALALQNLLGDLFGSLSILLDKPFVVGDFIVVGNEKGTVERIGIKTTRVRALSGEQLVFSNSDLLNGRLHNFKRMQERRIVFTISVTYETPQEKLREINDIIKQAIADQQLTRLDRCHLKAFGAYSLDFEVVYFVLSAEFGQYMNIQQAINFAIIAEFAKRKIDFAYPTAVEYQRIEPQYMGKIVDHRP